MGHPEREYPLRRARAFSSDERGSGTRDSKIEIVRAAALVLEPWVTAAVESRRFQSRQILPGPPSTLGALFFSRRSAEVLSIVGTVQPSRSPSLSWTLRNSIKEFRRSE